MIKVFIIKAKNFELKLYRLYQLHVNLIKLMFISNMSPKSFEFKLFLLVTRSQLTLLDPLCLLFQHNGCGFVIAMITPLQFTKTTKFVLGGTNVTPGHRLSCVIG